MEAHDATNRFTTVLVTKDRRTRRTPGACATAIGAALVVGLLVAPGPTPARADGKVVRASAPSPADEDGGVVPAGGVIRARHADACGEHCGKADCGHCRGRHGICHHGTCGPEIPGCPAHCPVRPERFGYYQTNWRRWPGQRVAQASFNEAVPVSPPRSIVPDVDDEAGTADDIEAGDDEAMTDPLPAPARGGRAGEEADRPAARTPPRGDDAGKTPAEKPVEPTPPKGKTDDGLFEQSAAPRPAATSLAQRMIQGMSRRKPATKPTPAARSLPVEYDSADGIVPAGGAEDAAAANTPAAVEPASLPVNPMRGR